MAEHRAFTSATAGLTTAQRDRVAGILVAQACGDALGVPYEFKPAFTDRPPEMIGGGLGPYAPGEWSDDTQMAICVAQVLAERATDMRSNTPTMTDEDAVVDEVSLGRIGVAFSEWRLDGASDIGNQTSAVLALAGRILRGGVLTADEQFAEFDDASLAQTYRRAAENYTLNHERSAGNGALMRNGIVGVSAVHDRDATAANARNIAQLTHADPLVLDSCVLHAEAIRHAVMTGEYDIFAGLDLLPDERRQQWVDWLESATRVDPESIEANGSTFGALRAAHAAISTTQIPEGSAHRGGGRLHVRAALEAAASCGDDTDTVAAITGALLGSIHGMSAVPATWRRRIHGWPGLRSRDLVALSLCVAGQTSDVDWPLRDHEPVAQGRGTVPLPCDDGVILGTQSHLATTDADAVVSLSRIGVKDRLFGDAHPENHVQFWLVDSNDPADHNDLHATLEDAADIVAELRAEGHRVFLHCVHAHHRTPSVAMLYAVKHRGLTPKQAQAEVCEALGVKSVDGFLWEAAALLAEDHHGTR